MIKGSVKVFFNKARQIMFFGMLFSSISLASENYIEDAKQYLVKHDYKSAIVQLKNALQQQPQSHESRYLLGKVYTEIGDGPSAEKELLLAQKYGSKEILLPALLGRAYLIQKKPDAVFQNIKIEPGMPVSTQADIHTLYGNAFLMQGKNTEARNAYEDALKKAEGHVDAMIGNAKIYLIDSKHKEAEILLQQVISIDLNKVDALLLLAEIKKQNKELPESKKYYDRVISVYPDNITALIGRATIFISMGEYQQGLSDVKKVKNRIPHLPMANHLMAVIYFQKKDYVAAKASLQEVQKVAPDFMPSQILIGTVSYLLGELQQAEFHLDKYIKTSPDNVRARLLLASVYIKLAQPEEAVKLLTVAVDKNMDNAEYLALLGTAYLQSGEADKGTDFLEKAVAVAPDAAALRTQLAMGYLASGKTEQAVSDLSTASEMDKDSSKADLMLILIKLKEKAYDDVIIRAKALAEKMEGQPVPYNFMGAAYLGKGDKQAARESFNKALTIKKDYVAAEINLAQMDLDEGDAGSARQRFERILSYDESNVSAMLGLAKLSEKEENYKDMLVWITRAKEKNPKDLMPYELLTKYYLSNGDVLNALNHARMAQDIAPDNPVVLRLLGLSQQAAGENASAVSTFRKLIRKFPDSSEALYLLAGALLESEEYKEAEYYLIKANKQEPENLLVQIRLITLYIKTKNTPQALLLTKKIKTVNPDKSVGYQLEGDIRMAEENYPSAVLSYEQAYQKQKSSVLATNIYKAYAATKNDSNKAQAVLSDWLKDNPKDLKVRILLATSFQQSGKNKEAITHYETFLSDQPDNLVALNNIAWLYFEEKNSKAIDYAEKAYKRLPNKPEVIDTYGWILVNNNKVDRGLQLLQDAVTKAPQNLEIRYHMAYGLYKANRKPEAVKELNRIFSLNKSFSASEEARQLLRELEK